VRPTALDSADSLYQHARHLGVPITEFKLIVTDAQAEELLTWLPASGLIAPEGLPQLTDDIAEARRKGDPLFVLQHFTFCGLTVAMAGKVLQ
jgi:hypothetical protein